MNAVCSTLKISVNSSYRESIEGQQHLLSQNTKYVNTSNLVKLIAKAHGKDIKIVPGFAFGLKVAGQMTVVNKAFGSLTYDKSMSGNLEGYNVA